MKIWINNALDINKLLLCELFKSSLIYLMIALLIPKSKITQVFVNSIIAPLILASVYVYMVYQAILLDEPLIEFFKLYLSLDNLYTVFATEKFLLIFWIHYVAINLFLGSWVARDGTKYNISHPFLFISLIFIYFAGPVGLVLYWFVRVFFAKRLGFHD